MTRYIMSRLIRNTIIFLLLTNHTHFANADFYDERLNLSDFYIKGSVSGNIFNNLKANGETLKSKFSPSVALGIGVYTFDNFRTDLTYEYYINPSFHHTSTNHPEHGNIKSKMKLKLATLMANFSLDLFELYQNKIFLHAGLGVAKHKTTYHATGTNAEGESVDVNLSNRTSYNFAYSLGMGIYFPLTHGVNIEAAYAFKDFGSMRPKKNEDGENISKKYHYRSHNLSLGFRFDL